MAKTAQVLKEPLPNETILEFRYANADFTAYDWYLGKVVSWRRRTDNGIEHEIKCGSTTDGPRTTGSTWLPLCAFGGCPRHHHLRRRLQGLRHPLHPRSCHSLLGSRRPLHSRPCHPLLVQLAARRAPPPFIAPVLSNHAC